MMQQTQNEFQMPADRILSSEAVYKAAHGQSTLRVYPTDHGQYRTWVIAAPHGSVTYWDAGNGWCQILHVDMKQQHEAEFWAKLGDLVSDDPEQSVAINDDLITRLLAQAGMYNPDAMLNDPNPPAEARTT